MRLKKLSRGPYLFERWEAPDEVVDCALGVVPLILITDIGGEPDERMMKLGEQLMAYVTAHDRELLDLIYGHYLFASEDDWLEFWKVPEGIQREQILSYVRSIEASVGHSDAEPSAGILADIRWDQEHKLGFSVEHGQLTRINESMSWHLDALGVLRLEP